MALLLDVRLDGHDGPVGALVRGDGGDVAFAYRPEHLRRPGAMPLSLSLPLQEEPFGDVATRAFFDNLLQERDGALARVMEREGLARDDVVGLLYHLGKDCAGALSVLPAGAPPVKLPGDLGRDYRPLGDGTGRRKGRCFGETPDVVGDKIGKALVAGPLDAGRDAWVERGGGWGLS